MQRHGGVGRRSRSREQRRRPRRCRAPLDEPSIQVGDADQGDRVSPDRRPKVLDDFAPVELTVLGIDHDPIEPEGHRHFGHAG